MSKHHVQQHKPPKESKSPSNKEHAELKRENHKLQRQIARLQKQVTKLIQQPPTEMDDVPVMQTDGLDCPGCNTPLRTVQLGAKTLRVCPSCSWRKMDAP